MEVLLLLGMLVTLAWGTVFFKKAGLWGMLVAMLPAGTVFGYYFFHAGPVTVDRLLLGLSLVILIVYRHLGLCEDSRWNKSDSLVVFFLFAMMLTTLLGSEVGQGSEPLSKFIFYFLLPIILYWCVRDIRLAPSQVRWLYIVSAAMGIYLSLTAIAEKFEVHSLVFPRFIVDPGYSEFLGRARGPLLNPSGNGVLLIFGMSAALLLWPHFQSRGKFAVAASLPIFLAGIYCTLTRCVWMGGVAALGVILFATMPKQFRAAFAIFGVMALGSVILWKSQSFVSFKRDKNVSQAEMEQSAQLRPMLATLAWKMFLDRPMMGCGTGRYLGNVPNYLGERDSELQLEKAKTYVQHNIFLSLLTENGLLGLLPFIGLFGLWIRDAIKLWGDRTRALEYRQFGLLYLCFMCGYLAIGMFQDVLIIPMISLYLFFFSGCLRNLKELRPSSRTAPTDVLGRHASTNLKPLVPTIRNTFTRRAAAPSHRSVRDRHCSA
jgi:hypothetical protein